jgi:hypothetical protein
MAEIFRAKVVGAGGFEKELVLKRILPARSQDRQFIRMLVNEAKLTVQLTHGNVAQIQECGAVDGVYFIAMELVHGASLKELLAAFPKAGGGPTPEQAMWLVLQVLQGLSYAHRKCDADGRPLQVVHCDVSPDNALVTWEGEVKLLDFGIARAAAGLSNYKEGMLMGKLGYVAPEQASADRAWDHRVDVFAAGVLLYELLTGRQPFPRALDPEGLLASRRTPVPPPSSHDGRLPAELDAIVARALAFDPDDRFPDARAFADALVDVLFPTPHSAIQESLSVRMRHAFADRIARERAARAHDALVMKVLQNTRRGQAVVEAPAPDVRPLSPEPTPVDTLPRPMPPAPRRRPRAAFPLRRALALALAAAALGAGGALAVGRRLETGTLVVTTEPPDARVAVNLKPVPGAGQRLVQVRLAERLLVDVEAPDRRARRVELPAERREIRHVHVRLESALVPVVVESEPAGALVRVDGKVAGKTPVTIDGLRADEPHRVDLVLAGYELDQFVVEPAETGTRFRRTLSPAAPTVPLPPKAP